MVIESESKWWTLKANADPAGKVVTLCRVTGLAYGIVSLSFRGLGENGRNQNGANVCTDAIYHWIYEWSCLSYLCKMSSASSDLSAAYFGLEILIAQCPIRLKYIHFKYRQGFPAFLHPLVVNCSTPRTGLS